MLIMAIRTFDAAFRHFVVERPGERCLLILVAFVAALGLVVLKQEFGPLR